MPRSYAGAARPGPSGGKRGSTLVIRLQRNTPGADHDGLNRAVAGFAGASDLCTGVAGLAAAGLAAAAAGFRGLPGLRYCPLPPRRGVTVATGLTTAAQRMSPRTGDGAKEAGGG